MLWTVFSCSLDDSQPPGSASLSLRIHQPQVAGVGVSRLPFPHPWEVPGTSKAYVSHGLNSSCPLWLWPRNVSFTLCLLFPVSLPHSFAFTITFQINHPCSTPCLHVCFCGSQGLCTCACVYVINDL